MNTKRGQENVMGALRLISTRSKVPVSMSTKEGRIRIQKLVYLLKAGGYTPARDFAFNLYVNGPYSPELAKVYYSTGDAGLKSIPPATDLPGPLLTTVVEANAHGIAFLEALTTTIDLVTSLRTNRASGATSAGLVWARSIKPHIKAEVWREVEEFLQTHKELAGST